MFREAEGRGLINRNPFTTIRHRRGDPSTRRVYVPSDVVDRVVESTPIIWWKLVFVLARYGGLRIPSEAFTLRWEDVNWELGRLVVHSPKTEHLPGRGCRVMPLFPKVRRYLELAFDATPPGAVYVFPDDWRRRAQGPYGWRNANLRTTAEKIIRRAGYAPWPRLFHALRGSCESDLATAFPITAVAKWLGNTPAIAMHHYVDPTDQLFAAALNWVPPTGVLTLKDPT